MAQITLHLPEPPSANKWWRRAGTHMHLSNEARAYKGLVKRHVIALFVKDTHPTLVRFPVEDVRVTLHWVRGRKSGDLDKRIGVVLDALQGVVYANDKQIVEIHASRSDNKGKASLRVTVEDV